MTTTKIAQVTDQMEKFWSPNFMKQLRARHVLINLIDKTYSGEIKKGGDTVRVSQINAPTGQLLTIGTDSDTFDSEAVSKSYVDLVINKRAVASHKFEDLDEVLSLIDGNNPQIMDALNYAVANQVNTQLFSLVSPSTSSPDHLRNSVTDFNKAELLVDRGLASTAKWAEDKGWWCLVDPSYYNDVLGDATLGSSDYGAGDAPVIAGKVALPRFGFNILEDRTMSTDTALLFEPNFMHLAMPYQAQIKISDLHPLGQFGYLMSVDVIFGAVLGNDGSKKHIKVLAA